MDRLFLDANVLFSAAYRTDTPMRRLWRLSRAELFTSTYAAEEARRNLREDRQREDFEELLASMTIAAASADTGSYPVPEPAQRPEKDVPILLAAIGAGATHLITGDFTHFGPLYGGKIGGVLILPPAQCLRGIANFDSTG